jgi:hypothetical protein
MHRKILDLVESTTGKKIGLWAETDKDLMNAVHLAMAGGETSNPAVVKLRDGFREIQSDFMERMQKVGVNIGQLENRAVRVHNSSIIASRPDEWRKFMKDSLDEAMHPDSDDAVDQIYKSVVNAPFKHRGTDTVISDTRQVFFKTPELEHEYFKRFSGADPFDAMMNDMDALARNTVMAEKFGVQPHKTLEVLLGKLDDRARDRGSIADKKYLKARKNAANRVKALKQHSDSPKVPSSAAWIGVARTFYAASLLSRAVTSSLGFDTITASWNAKGLKGNSWASGLTNMMDGAMKSGQKDIIDRMGVVTDLSIGSTLSHMAPVDHVLGDGSQRLQKWDRRSQKWLGGMLRLTGLPAVTRGQQRGVAGTWAQSLAAAADVPFSQLAKHDDYLFKRVKDAGITEKSWNNAVVGSAVDKNMGMWDFDKVTDIDAAREIVGFIAREVDTAVTRPDMMTRYHAAFGTEAGTAAGEITRSMMQFQGFLMQYVANVWGTMRSHNNVDNAGLFAAMMGVGVAKAQLDQWLADKPMYNYDSPMLYTSAIEKSGIFWLAGSAVHGMNFSLHARGTPATLGDMLDAGYIR